ncbi:unnamed protein product [Polarella glacialis]|uniref:Rab-GAP TBC domain-containing protein n=1 Tax=Polarella glacialis TaxID=89957 RepID=A0A813E868_POLGL|nr:unnamed protein product [Polarella glacialis]
MWQPSQGSAFAVSVSSLGLPTAVAHRYSSIPYSQHPPQLVPTYASNITQQQPAPFAGSSIGHMRSTVSGQSSIQQTQPSTATSSNIVIRAGLSNTGRSQQRPRLRLSVEAVAAFASKCISGSRGGGFGTAKSEAKSPNSLFKAAAHSLTAGRRFGQCLDESPTRRLYVQDRAVDQEAVHQLDVDLPRTAGGEPLILACIGRIRSMILQHLAEDPELGYCQGMTLVAAAFAAAAGRQSEAYSRFSAFMKRVRGLWMPGFPLLEVATAAFEALAQQRPWYQHLRRYEVSPGMFLPQALLTMFVSWLPLSTLTRSIGLLEHAGLAGMLAMTLAVLDHAGPHLLKQLTFEDLLDELKLLKSKAPQPEVLEQATQQLIPQAVTVLVLPSAPVRARSQILKRKGSRVVDENGQDAFAEGNLSAAPDWLASESSAAALSWVEADTAAVGGAVLRWAFGECEAPLLDNDADTLEIAV